MEYQIKNAVTGKSELRQRPLVTTTCDFGHNNVLGCYMAQPGDTINLSVRQFVRLDPMPCPTFGPVWNNVRAFSVDVLKIFPRLEEFMAFTNGSDQNFNARTYPETPWFTINNLVSSVVRAHDYFLKEGSSDGYDPSLGFKQRAFPNFVDEVDVDDVIGGAKYDFRVYEKADADPRYYFRYFRFNYFGKRWYYILRGLGYKFTWYSCMNEDPVDERYNPDYIHRHISALPLFAYVKVMMDYYLPNRYYFDLEFDYIRKFIANACETDNLYVEKGIFSDIFVNNDTYNQDYFFNSIFADYFLSAYFANDFYMSLLPSNTGANSQSQSIQPIVDMINKVLPGYPSLNDSVGVNSVQVEGKDVFYPYFSENNYLTLQSLGVIQNMLTRSMISGDRIHDYFKDTFGVDLDFDEVGLARPLGETSHEPITIGDIPATASTEKGPEDTEGTYLGQYAGRGYLDKSRDNDSIHFKVTASDKVQQIVIVLQEILPEPIYGFGEDNVTICESGNWFRPDTDGLGYEGIPLSAMVSSSREQGQDIDQESDLFNLDVYNKVLGYAPTHSRWKIENSCINGDFCLPSRNTGLDSWYIDRNFNFDNLRRLIEANGGSVLIAIAYMYAYTAIPANDFDRIFQSGDIYSDHFKCQYRIDIIRNTNMKPISISLSYDDDQAKNVERTRSNVNNLD